MSLRETRKEMDLVKTMREVKGNPKICLVTEPLWTVPFNLYMPFVSVYMAALLLTDSQIGLVASTFLFFSAIAALFSGAITDKLGRKKTTFLFDTLAWSIPCLLWAFSQNFWWFMAAAAFNGMMQITTVSWTCLLVEDVQKGYMAKVYSLLHMIGQLSILFMPIAFLLVNQLSLVPAMRILFIFSFISMTLKFIILYKYGDETEVGRTRMTETKGMSIWQIMGGYGEIFRRIFASRDMILSLAITTIFGIIGMVITNFFGLYVTGTLLIPEYFLAVFPVIRAIVIAAFLIFIQPKLQRFGFRSPMLIGLCIHIAGTVFLIASPAEAMITLIIYILIDALAFSLVAPRSDSLTQLLIEPSERARIRGLMMVIVLGLSIPFGYLAGLLSDMDRRLPFALCIALLIVILIVIAASKQRLAAMSKAEKMGS
ncbi:MAG: MFS transporter [Oscillospiraceae bacterium]|nr:MFS transporter [Oscillospiraceae bacterium]MCL2278493.1 MFS transporter [Oscillospiraceae bacterium]